MTKLFLLQPDFTDRNADNEGLKYFCPQSAIFEGVFKYYPQLEKQIEIHRVNFERPRQEIIDLIGMENQSCPVLIIDQPGDNNLDTSYFNSYGDKLFVNTVDLIALYLSESCGIANLH